MLQTSAIDVPSSLTILTPNRPELTRLPSKMLSANGATVQLDLDDESAMDVAWNTRTKTASYYMQTFTSLIEHTAQMGVPSQRMGVGSDHHPLSPHVPAHQDMCKMW